MSLNVLWFESEAFSSKTQNQCKLTIFIFILLLYISLLTFAQCVRLYFDTGETKTTDDSKDSKIKIRESRRQSKSNDSSTSSTSTEATSPLSIDGTPTRHSSVAAAAAALAATAPHPTRLSPMVWSNVEKLKNNWKCS